MMSLFMHFISFFLSLQIFGENYDGTDCVNKKGPSRRRALLFTDCDFRLLLIPNNNAINAVMESFFSLASHYFSIGIFTPFFFAN